MPASSPAAITPLPSFAHRDEDPSSSFTKITNANAGNNLNSSTTTSKSRQRRQSTTASSWTRRRTMPLGGAVVLVAALFSWEVLSGVKMTHFEAEIGMMEESLLLLNSSIASISEKLYDITATRTTPLEISTTFSSLVEQGLRSININNNDVKAQSQQPHGGAAIEEEDYRFMKRRSPVVDLLCTGCRSSMTSLKGGTLACGNMIKNQMQKLLNHKSHHTPYPYNRSSEALLRDAVNRVLKIAPKECDRCRFDACSNNSNNATGSSSEKEYWRPDNAAPHILMSKTLQLSTIPGEHRVPPFVLLSKNLTTTYFSDQNNVYPARTYYFEYNPSIIQIPTSQIPTRYQVGYYYMADDQQEDMAYDQQRKVKYLASFRVTNMQQCISGIDELAMIGGKWPRPQSQDYLGLALLRSDLSVVANVVLNTKNNHVPSLSNMEDYRLFVLQDQIYVASYHEIVPIWLVPPKDANVVDHKTIRLVPNLFTSNLTVMARSYSSCPNIRMGSKNINYIWDHERNETIVEDVPMGRKMTIDLHKKCRVNQYRPNSKLQNINAGKDLKVARSNIPFRSFGSMDELHFAKHGVFRNVLTGERGSACCVRITDPRRSSISNVNDTSHKQQQKELWLGISHSKFKFRNKENRNDLPGNVSANHFFSTFYAFDTHEPFSVQAISGRFCLGFPTLNETATSSTSTTMEFSDKNPYGRHNTNALRLGADYFDCPAIHFVSGMVEKANDPSRIIIAYGVNDCAPRFVEVEKKEIQQMLFSKRQR